MDRSSRNGGCGDLITVTPLRVHGQMVTEESPAAPSAGLPGYITAEAAASALLRADALQPRPSSNSPAAALAQTASQPMRGSAVIVSTLRHGVATTAAVSWACRCHTASYGL